MTPTATIYLVPNNDEGDQETYACVDIRIEGSWVHFHAPTEQPGWLSYPVQAIAWIDWTPDCAPWQ
jgi:hypothetical protein